MCSLGGIQVSRQLYLKINGIMKEKRQKLANPNVLKFSYAA